jgi:hypothetical protein
MPRCLEDPGAKRDNLGSTEWRSCLLCEGPPNQSNAMVWIRSANSYAQFAPADDSLAALKEHASDDAEFK